MKAKKNFSSFDWASAFKELGIEVLLHWEVEFQPMPPSDYFKERWRRLEVFDLTNSERAKELLIDAIIEEVIQPYRKLKIWKAAPLESEDLIGQADYLAAPRRAYLEAPLLCVVEAKKDNFEKGLAQCLVEMKACQWNNQQQGKDLDVYGIVTNGEGWRFYKLSTAGEVYETLPQSLGAIEKIFGLLSYVFSKCEESISNAQTT